MESVLMFCMIFIGLILIFLGAKKRVEPLLLLPIGFGMIMANIPGAEQSSLDDGCILSFFYQHGIKTVVLPCLIFFGIGAHTDFGPLIRNPRLIFFGAAAQAGIFVTILGALGLNYLGIDFTLMEAAATGIIGGADGPTSIFTATKLAPDLLGPISIAAYSYMALVPLIQKPVGLFFTSSTQRKINMKEMDRQFGVPGNVTPLKKFLFPIFSVLIACILVPTATPLLGMLLFGNLIKETKLVVVDRRMVEVARDTILNASTIILGLAIGGTMEADKFFQFKTIGILVLGVVAFAIGSASGIIGVHIHNIFAKKKINPLIGMAGVSAVPMSARVVQDMGVHEDPNNNLLQYAMAPNVAGVIGSAVAAGFLLRFFMG
ncbi:sodium ion-translocating decarboxylase subunit beta [candidate division KSB1 bacterium]|nr:sodium ion-translocating decarboxylase subunit beta [candidate division KSB1 bacterium]